MKLKYKAGKSKQHLKPDTLERHSLKVDVQSIPHHQKIPFINGEKSWLAFNERVYALALKTNYPLFERLRFLSIAANNLDEFYMVHFGRLYSKTNNKTYDDESDIPSDSEEFMTEQIEELQELAMLQMREHVKLWVKLRKNLRDEGIDAISPKDLMREEIIWLEEYFLDNIFPLLTPMALDASHPVPLIPSRGIAVVVQLQSKKDDIPVYAFIPLPIQLKRFVELPHKNGNHLRSSNGNGKANHHQMRYIAIEHVISMFLEHLFSNYNVLAQGIFRIIRNSQMGPANVSAFMLNLDLRDEFEEALTQRLHGDIIQLTVNARMPENLRLFVSEQFDVDPAEVIVIDGFLGIEEVRDIIDNHHPKLLFPPFEGRVPPRIKHTNFDIFESINIKDILVHHPYESFDVIVMFLRMAARDKSVVAIKMTLYRTGSNSEIIAALIEAVKNGISVTVLVEIKARFDEEANIRWTKDLESAGAHVIYGLYNLKTHAKLCLVIRKEGNIMKGYTHFGTGNYNAKTSEIYSDLSLLTADKTLCQDAAKIFHHVTGYARTDNLQKIAVSPSNLRDKLEELIQEEIKHVKNGRPGNIWLKMNALTDHSMIHHLYKASQAGVKIDLIVRSMCSLIPGVPGLSENIRVKSIVGRFLEHARIFCFGNGEMLPNPQAKVFISSADWMPRNLDRRFEIMVPAENPTVHKQILEQIMVSNFNDRAGSWELKSDGHYESLQTNEDDFSAQDYFMKNPSLSGSGVGPYPVIPHLIKPQD